MACGDQSWDPSLEDKMVKWTSAASEFAIDRAAKQLGLEKQFGKKKRKVDRVPVERGVHIEKGVAVRIDSDARSAVATVPEPEDDEAPLLVLDDAATYATLSLAPEAPQSKALLRAGLLYDAETNLLALAPVEPDGRGRPQPMAQPGFRRRPPAKRKQVEGGGGTAVAAARP
eukprot:CAMPEP_0184206056 /NCGR_PEP_ID=MMETSP0976-20121227/10395_1 /TAXON_ID=483370 /ORGANISM="non described non described, Strain CCMP2097" /LENGTH=171 /DNA_ID=CAMNT_0026510673 /DNA_START=141 /DNA_END=653 /DNA_ORIENTATION=-